MNAVSSITPLPSTQGLVPRVGEWAAHLEIDWPHGVEQHPRLRHRMQRDLKRICVIDRSVKGLGLTCALHAADRPEAEADAAALADELLGRLGLGPTALRACRLLDLSEGSPEPGQPTRLRSI